MDEQTFCCDYQVYINARFVAETNDPTEVWDIIGKYPFGSLYEVGSSNGKDVTDFIPF